MFGRTIIATVTALALAPAFAANSFPMEPQIEVHLATPKGSTHTTQIGRSETKKVTLDGVEYTLKGNGAKKVDDIDVEVTPKDKTAVRVTVKDPA
ncbi:hypothetical protein [Chitinimonas lacunae]|uniref:DUF5666 domain-containing protein n=1 Tax=Chitinimonas lacunae TaxID=1963018 RepID=A0ABV8MN61_9NEIS